MLESLSLDGKSVVITGGGTGLGRAMVRDMARAGANLVIAGRRTGPIEEAAAEEGVGQSVEEVELLEEAAFLAVDGEVFFVSPDAVSSFFVFASDGGPGSEVAGSGFPFPA